MKAISLFDYTGNMLKPWLEAGYECHLIDNQHPKGHTVRDDGMHLWNIDLRLPLPALFADGVAFVSAFPPCTDVAVSGARWFKGKGLRALQEAIACFATAAEFCEAVGAPYVIENPVSTISTYWRKPDHTFHPHEFTELEPSDNYTKKTCLWVGNGFVMPLAQKSLSLSPPDNRIHACPPSEDRAAQRSETPMGFSRAVFEANHKEGSLLRAENELVEIVVGIN